MNVTSVVLENFTSCSDCDVLFEQKHVLGRVHDVAQTFRQVRPKKLL